MGHLQHECHPMYAIQESVATGQFRHQESVIDTHKPWQQGTQVCFKDRTALLQQRQQLRQREHQEIPKLGFWGCNPSQPLSTPPNLQTYPTSPPLFEELKPGITHSNPT